MKVLFVLFIALLPVPVISNVQEHEQMNKVIDVPSLFYGEDINNANYQ